MLSNTYPNQIKVMIDKPKLKEMKTFAYYDRQALANACKCLNGSEFKLWIYLMAQAPQTEWWISQKASESEFGILEASYHRAIKGLRNKGYLEDDVAIYQFPKEVCNQDDNSNQIDDNDVIKMKEDSSQSDDRNNISNSINNNSFLNTNVEKAEKTYEKIMSSKELDYIFSDNDEYNWRDYVDSNGILTTLTNHKIKVNME